jgi:glycosyltransferase involved in cell wall biosynthesis
VTRPALTILTPSFNQVGFIDQTIRSVLDQGYPALDYFVLDGGSTDGTVALLDGYGDRLRFISGPDGGQAAALNRGFDESAGEIIGWINSDDYYAPGAFDAIAEIFATRPEVQWLYGRCPIVDANGAETRGFVTRYKEFWMKHYFFERLMIENFINQPTVFFRRSLLDRVGRIDETMRNAFDYHLFLRMAEKARPFYLERVLAYFRVHVDAKTSSNFERSFREETDAAAEVAGDRHPLLIALHQLNYYKLTTAYRLLRALKR